MKIELSSDRTNIENWLEIMHLCGQIYTFTENYNIRTYARIINTTQNSVYIRRRYVEAAVQ